MEMASQKLTTCCVAGAFSLLRRTSVRLMARIRRALQLALLA